MRTTAMSQKRIQTSINLIVGFVLVWLIIIPAQAVKAETQHTYTAWVEKAEPETIVGEPYFIIVGLEPADPPLGSYISVLVDVVEKPEGSKPEILTGFPQVRLNLMQAGFYRFVVRVSLLAKSSCGGIDSTEIMAEEIQLEVIDP